MKKIILATILAASVSATAFAGAAGVYAASTNAGTGASTVLSDLFSAKMSAMQTVTFAVKAAADQKTSAAKQAAVSEFLRDLGADEVMVDVKSSLFKATVKTANKIIWCAETSMGPGAPTMQIVCATKASVTQSAAEALSTCHSDNQSA